MVKFTEFNKFEPLGPQSKKYRLTDPMKYELHSKGSGNWITIPKGTIFDISVPVMFEWLVSPHDRRVLLASLIHDWMGENGYSTLQASREFVIAAKALGASLPLEILLFWSTFIYTTVWRLINWHGLNKPENKNG